MALNIPSYGPQAAGGPIYNVFNKLAQDQLANRGKESEIGYRNALTSKVPTDVAFTEAQTNKLNALTPLEVQQAQAKINDILQMNEIVKNIFATKNNATQQNSQSPLQNNINPSQPNQQINGSPINPLNENNNNVSEMPQTNALVGNNIPQNNVNAMQQNPQQNAGQLTGSQYNITYPQAAILHHKFGLGPPSIQDINGTKMALTAFGAIPVAQGLTPYEEGLQKGLGKVASTFYGDNLSAYQKYQNQGLAIENITHAIQNDPEFRNVTGPVGSFLTNWTGTKEQKELLGSLRSSSGEIALQVAPSLKGAFTGRDQQLINSIKANPNTDFADVFIGKLKAQKLIGDTLAERARLAAQYTESGSKPLAALTRATQETPLEKLRPQVEKMIQLNPNKVITIKNPSTGEQKQITVKEAREKYKMNI